MSELFILMLKVIDYTLQPALIVVTPGWTLKELRLINAITTIVVAVMSGGNSLRFILTDFVLAHFAQHSAIPITYAQLLCLTGNCNDTNNTDM